MTKNRKNDASKELFIKKEKHLKKEKLKAR